MRGDFEGAEGVLRAAIEQARGAGEGGALARLGAELAEVLGQAYFYRNRGGDEAIAIALGAQRDALRAGDRGAQAQAVEAEGMVRYGRLLYRNAKDFSEARGLFERALAMRQADRELGASAKLFFHVGLTYEQEGRKTQAQAHYEKALSLGEQAGDKMAQAYALRHLAGFHEERGDLEQALAFHRRCAALREEVGAQRLVAYALISIGELEVKKGDVAGARATYERALRVAEQTKGAPALLSVHQGLGALDEREGRCDSALAHYQLALAQAEALSDHEGIATAAGAAAKLYQTMGDEKRSRELAEQAERARAKAAGG